MNDYRSRFAIAGFIVAAVPFPGEGGRLIHYAFRREPGDEVCRGWRKGREYFVDLGDGRWTSWTDDPGQWRPFEQLLTRGADVAGNDAGSGETGESGRPDQGNRISAVETRQDGSAELADLPAECRPWFARCVAAGFRLVDVGGSHRGPGFDTGNRFAKWGSTEELLCGRTQRIVDRRFEKWTLEDYLQRFGGIPKAGEQLITTPAWKVAHPSGPIAAKQPALFG